MNKGNLRLGIDACNIRAGGGITHLVELLRAVDPSVYGFKSVVVWSGARTLAQIEERSWLTLVHVPALDGNLVRRVSWQRTQMNEEFRARCDLLFVPGGSYLGNFQPFVTMSQNLLPFDPQARRRYGASMMRLKLSLLRQVQGRTFKAARGVIFLTEYARDAVLKGIGGLRGKDVVIPHGVTPGFMREPTRQLPLDAFSEQRPFRWLYVSTVDVYKHQAEVVAAVAELRAGGLPVTLDLIGPPHGASVIALRNALNSFDPRGHYIRYLGAVPRAELAAKFHAADAFVFASSSETFGIILLDAMAAGLPIACSKRSSMPETLGDAGVYFDPTDVPSMASAMKQLMRDPATRESYAQRAHMRAQTYSWERCAHETFDFLASVAAKAPNRAFAERTDF